MTNSFVFYELASLYEFLCGVGLEVVICSNSYEFATS